MVIYAFGLGQTTPAVKTGEATPATAPNLLTTTVTVDFDFRPNATASHPYNNPGTTANPGPILPIFAGLTPGQVGLYQINIKLPDRMPPVIPCSASLGVQSNLTIDIGGTTSGGISSTERRFACCLRSSRFAFCLCINGDEVKRVPHDSDVANPHCLVQRLQRIVSLRR